ncbi:hypothetical protein WOLCODRAFT_166741 [Wolfiporia cocos MD-104 SS10]|uniref:Telomere replication protein EST3 n=1 Tax=Wolfiporia cocos (strain MD-104) TaxID=742152 RepID=A0A2H3J1S1_WOLCO|nr:hypothetical protein WOLCODRAFT_166741 [Wolfiporia cocos MD-104 SS10]
MSMTIPRPWICDYLVGVAETHGGDLAAVPPRTKLGKAQIFSTRLRGPTDDAFVWALLSDKSHIISARFSKEAVGQYRLNPQSHGKTFTDHKTALIFIKDFRPFCSRVPLGMSRGMSSSEHLALDVGSFEFKGAFDDPVWGTPVDVETDRRVAVWLEGLRQHGGAGNVLKLRKLAQSRALEQADFLATFEKNREERPAIGVEMEYESRKVPISGARKTVASKSPSASIVPSAEPAVVSRKADGDPMKALLQSWKPYQSRVRKYALPPEDVLSYLRRNHDDYEGRPDKVAKPADVDGSVGPSSQASSPCPQAKRPSQPLHYIPIVAIFTNSGIERNPLDISSSPSQALDRDIPDEILPRTPSNWSPSIKGTQSLSRSSSPGAEDDMNTDGERKEYLRDSDSPIMSQRSFMNHKKEHSSLVSSQHALSSPSQPPQPENTEPTGSSRSQDLRLQRSPSIPSLPPSPRQTDDPAHDEGECSCSISNPTLPSSYLSAPPPAQRPRSPAFYLPPSSTSQPSIPGLSDALLSMPATVDRPSRYVPLHLPQTRRMPLLTNGQSPGRVLVPNSDTSGSGLGPDSQPMMQSQSMSQPQLSQSQPTSHPHVRNEVPFEIQEFPVESQAQGSSVQKGSQEQGHNQFESQNESQSQVVERHRQSLSYTPQSQSQSHSQDKSLPPSQSHSQSHLGSQPRSQGGSQLRNEVCASPRLEEKGQSGNVGPWDVSPALRIPEAPSSPQPTTKTKTQHEGSQRATSIQDDINHSRELHAEVAMNVDEQQDDTGIVDSTIPGEELLTLPPVEVLNDNGGNETEEDDNSTSDNDDVEVAKLEMRQEEEESSGDLAREKGELAGHEEEEKDSSSDHTSADDEGSEGEGEIDQLKSDGESSEAETDAVGKVANQLDSDDAATKATVERSLSRTRADSARPPHITASSSMTARQMEPQKSSAQLRGSRGSDGPLPPSSPDVFTNDESLQRWRSLGQISSASGAPSQEASSSMHPNPYRKKQAVSGTNLQPKAFMQHDPEVWKAPTFTRRPSGSNGKEKAVEADVPLMASSFRLRSSARPKRVISVPSSPEPPERPMKQQKTSASTSVPVDVRHSTEKTLKCGGRHAATSSKELQSDREIVPNRSSTRRIIPHVDLRRSVSATPPVRSLGKRQSGRHLPADTSGSGPVVSTVRSRSPGGSHAVEIRHVDFRPRASSITSSKATPRERVSITQDSQRSRPRTSKIPPARRAHVSVDSRHRELRPDQASIQGATPIDVAGSSRLPTKLLGNYQIDFDMSRQEDGPPLITWEDLQAILLRTGRARTMMKRQQEEEEKKRRDR